MQEQTRQMNDAISACDAAIESGDATSVGDTILKINPDFRDPQYTRIAMVNGDSTKQVCIVIGFVENLKYRVTFLEWF